ncbi:CLUMA_CG020531, isoform A [Clunio marinus]|uniref:CLUMA_CG020531, isoform A n=1 Tax=Clunio marinus TaxID=568069 RepID=A0A1J1J7W3_9DIPT|nr:CLUMA_CG020531, isoform A [Clunio marinus]
MNSLLMKCLCVLTIIGLAAATRPKFELTSFNSTTFVHKPYIPRNDAEPFWDPNFCDGWRDRDIFVHPERCEGFLMCWGGELLEFDCPRGMIFDFMDLVCDFPDQAVCWMDARPPPVIPDNHCPPPGSNEVRFLPSVNCDEYYICMNGRPVLLQCAPGQHWNIQENSCDDPARAGCAPVPPPNQLPNCPPGVTRYLPHPTNCNWFIYCNNGNRSVQQCRPLQHFDINLERCLVKTIARCITNTRTLH